jgi:hypothetical protein
MNNRIFGPYLAAMHRILVTVKQERDWLQVYPERYGGARYPNLCLEKEWESWEHYFEKSPQILEVPFLSHICCRGWSQSGWSPLCASDLIIGHCNPMSQP